MLTIEEKEKLTKQFADGKPHKLSKMSEFLGRQIKPGEIYLWQMREKNCPFNFVSLIEKLNQTEEINKTLDKQV